MKELEEQQRLERERRQKEEEELYKDVEKLAKVIIISLVIPPPIKLTAMI